ncbi:MAG: hypothetical protein ACE5IZ_10255 [Dehalococcoidia bacterium]
MLPARAATRISIAISLIILLAVVAAGAPRYAQAQQPTTTPQAEVVVVVDEPFPWWDFLTGIGTIMLALAAFFAVAAPLRQYLDQRRRESTRELARHHGALVALLAGQHERTAPGALRDAIEGELVQAERIYESILRGIMLMDREMVRLQREALQAALEVAQREMERLRRESEGG